MDSLQQRHKFDPFELETVDRVYEVACRHARNLYCDAPKSAEQEETLRKMVFACAASGKLDFDTLCDQVLARHAEISPSRRAA